MIDFKLGEQAFQLPASWNEVTVGQFKKIMNPKKVGDLTEIVCILSGLDYDTLFNSVRPTSENVMLCNAISWAATIPDWFNTPLPNEFKIAGKVVDYKKDILKMPFGQYASFVSLAAINPMTWKEKLYCNINTVDKAIAIYLYPEYSGEEFTDKWESLLPEIEKLPFMESFAVASFFLNKLNSSEKSKVSNSNLRPAKKKRKRG
jgi:hypothetical protein